MTTLKAPFPGGKLIRGLRLFTLGSANFGFGFFGVMPPAAIFLNPLPVFLGQLFTLVSLRQLAPMFCGQRFALPLLAQKLLCFFALRSPLPGRANLRSGLFGMMPAGTSIAKVFAHFRGRVIWFTVLFHFGNRFRRVLAPPICRRNFSDMFRCKFSSLFLLGHNSPRLFTKVVSHDALAARSGVAKVGPFTDEMAYPLTFCFSPIADSFFQFDQQGGRALPGELVQPVCFVGSFLFGLIDMVAQTLARLIRPTHIANTACYWINKCIDSPFTR